MRIRLTYIIITALVFLFCQGQAAAPGEQQLPPDNTDSAYVAGTVTDAEEQILILKDYAQSLEREQAKLSRLLVVTWILGGILLALILITAAVYFFRKRSSPALQPEARLAPSPKLPHKRPSAMNDNELFHYISDIIKREQLYLNPMLDRQALINRLGGLSAHRIGAAFSKGSEYRSLPGYIRNLRLEYACELLVSHPDLNVKAIGEASGFSNNSTFCSDFKARFGVTPSDYRQTNQPQNI